MFADSLCESHHSGRGWITLATFAVQTLTVAMLLALPLLHTEGLPRIHPTVEPLLSSPLPDAPLETRRLISHPSNPVTVALIVPRQASHEMKLTPPENSPPQVEVGLVGIPGGTGNRWNGDSIINSIANPSSNFSLPSRPQRQPPRVSRMMEGNLILRVQPLYPPLARQARIQGQVVLRAVISRSGAIENLQVLTGHPMLVQSAIDAVKQWRYRPYSLNGEAVEVETQVTVNFVLSGG
jgi:periplasmic protein TonB